MLLATQIVAVDPPLLVFRTYLDRFPNASTMQKRVACITGASSGIGRTSAIALAKTGQWRIVLSGRREQELEKTAQMCRDAAGSTDGDEDLTLIVAGDVSEESNVESLFDAIKKTYGKSNKA